MITKNKKIFLFSFLLIFSFIAFGSAALSVSSPSASTVAGTIILNATGIVEMNNCTFYVKSSGLTANTTWITIATFLNDTASQNYVNGTVNTAGLEDGTDYIFNATCKNTSLTQNAVTSAKNIDNTVPTAPSSLTPTDKTLITSATTPTFSSTVVNKQTTSCTYVIGRGGTALESSDTTAGTGTYSDSTCSFTKAFSSEKDNGMWYWYTVASDGTNTTESVRSTYQVAIQAAGGGGGGGSFIIETSSPKETEKQAVESSETKIGNFFSGLFESIKNFFTRIFNK